jgi:tRNA A-37 threonylcarbamoyl transferase component Bud32
LEDDTLTLQPLQKVLHNLWQQQFPGQAAPRHFDFLWERSDRKVLLYVFADELPTPVFFGKSSDNKFVSKRLHQEALVLTKLKELDHYLSETIPQPLYCSTVRNQTILFEKMIYGEPLSNFIKPYSTNTLRSESEDHFHWVTEWTIQLHQKTTVEIFQLNAQRWKEFFVECCRQFNQDWGIKTDDRKWEVINTWLEKCEGLPLPKVIDHGDLTPHQILVSKNGYNVIDWELSPLLELPCHDLINFFMHYNALMQKRAKFIERDLKNDNITDLFFYQNTDNLFVEYIKRYLVEMEIHPYFIIPILYARYPRLSLNESVCEKIVEILSV